MNCEFCKMGLPITVVVLVAFIVTYQFVPPSPPREFRIATGSTTGAYYAYALEYQKDLTEQDFHLLIQTTAGSMEALRLLQEGKVDLAFIQGGVAKEISSQNLRSLASLFYEPLWVFYHQNQAIQYLYDLRGKRVSIGVEGSGTRSLARQLLQDNGIDANNTTLLGLTNEEAKQKLIAGEIDVAFLVISPKATIIYELLQNPSLALLSFQKRALAYTSRYNFLSSIVIGRGLINLQNDIPREDTVLLTTTASLVARQDIPPNRIRLILREAQRVHGQHSLLERERQFPATTFLDIPIHPEAERYLHHGSPWLEQVFPLWIATQLDRLKIMLIPLLTLLFPLIKGIIPLYQWRLRFKTYRWYDTLHQVELQLDCLDIEAIDQEIERLTTLHGDLVKQVSIPLSYMSEFYDLRLHINLILSRLRERRELLQAPQRESGIVTPGNDRGYSSKG